MARRKREPGREDAAETRDLILRTARHMFREQGYRAVSTRKIAKACDLTQPLLYHYFQDKQQLYVEVLRDDIDQARQRLFAIAGQPATVTERLAQAIEHLLLDSRKPSNQMMHDMEHELKEEQRAMLFRGFYEGIMAPLAAILGDALRSRAVDAPSVSEATFRAGMNPMQAAQLLLSMLDRGSERFRGDHPGNVTAIRAYADGIAQLLLYGLIGLATNETI